MPNEVKISASVRNLIEFCDNSEFFNAGDDISTENSRPVELLSLKNDIKCLKMEMNCIKTLNSELDRSVLNQHKTNF